MYKIVDVSKDEKSIIKLYRLFDGLGNSIMPNKKRYMFFCKIGKAYAIMNCDKIVGGLVMYPEKNYNVILNCYTPEDSRKSKMFLRILELISKFRGEHNKRTFFRAEDVSDYKRIAKPLDGIEDNYELLIPAGIK